MLSLGKQVDGSEEEIWLGVGAGVGSWYAVSGDRV